MNAPVSDKQAPYKIEKKVWPERYARGWHVIGKPEDFDNKPQMLEYFGTRLAAYRGEDGKVVVLDAYCPHMGADLSKGEVKGNSLVCPFHHWSWGNDGACDHIPYAKNIPKKAVIGSWPTLEKNGLVLVWNDHEGNEPIAEQEPVAVEGDGTGEWTDWVMAQFPIHTHCRELVDNMADFGHFGPVHYTDVKSFNNLQKDHTFTQNMVGGNPLLAEGEGSLMTTVAHYEGPAYMITKMTGMMDEQPMKVNLLVSHIPVDTGKFFINFGVRMQKNPALTEKQNQTMVAEYTQQTITSFEQDVEIWDNKVLVDNPILCDGDGPLNMLRKWYSQFYMDVADIPSRLTEEKTHVTREGISVADAQAEGRSL